jgi:hypothetical protein
MCSCLFGKCSLSTPLDIWSHVQPQAFNSGSKNALHRAFLSRTSRALDLRPTIQHIYSDNMAPPQTGPKKSSRRSRKARTEGAKEWRILHISKHRLTSSSLFVLGIIFRLRQRRLDLKLRAQTTHQTAFENGAQGCHEGQKKRQPFACRGNSASS